MSKLFSFSFSLLRSHLLSLCLIFFASIIANAQTAPQCSQVFESASSGVATARKFFGPIENKTELIAQQKRFIEMREQAQEAWLTDRNGRWQEIQAWELHLKRVLNQVVLPMALPFSFVDRIGIAFVPQIKDPGQVAQTNLRQIFVYLSDYKRTKKIFDSEGSTLKLFAEVAGVDIKVVDAKTNGAELFRRSEGEANSLIVFDIFYNPGVGSAPVYSVNRQTGIKTRMNFSPAFRRFR